MNRVIEELKEKKVHFQEISDSKIRFIMDFAVHPGRGDLFFGLTSTGVCRDYCWSVDDPVITLQMDEYLVSILYDANDGPVGIAEIEKIGKWILEDNRSSDDIFLYPPSAEYGPEDFDPLTRIHMFNNEADAAEYLWEQGVHGYRILRPNMATGHEDVMFPGEQCEREWGARGMQCTVGECWECNKFPVAEKIKKIGETTWTK